MSRAPSRPWGFAGWRWELLGAAAGRTLEIGCGRGHNFDHYPPGAQVTAFDLDSERLAIAARLVHRRSADSSPPTRRAPIRLAQADAEHLGWDSRSFDSVVGTLVFCSIPEPATALAEARRVLRPGGRLYLVEHVRAPGLLGRAQDALAPLWLWSTGGCHLTRDTETTVRQAGFNIDQLKIGWGGALKLIVVTPRP